VWERPVPGLVGPRKLQARLLDSTGRRALDTSEIDLILDDQKPRNLAIDVRGPIERGTRNLPVKASVTPPPSGIKEVAFIFGRKDDFDKVAAAGGAIQGQPGDSAGRSWSATLPIPKDAPAKLVVTARFKTGVGLTDFAVEEVELTEPAQADEKAKPAAPKPGAIEGIVREGNLNQAGLDVYLIDPSAPKDKPSVKKTTTDDKGAFSFKDLEANKEYRLYCVKRDGITNRAADKMVMVEADKTAKIELELLR
jgi:hypothetical protein